MDMKHLSVLRYTGDAYSLCLFCVGFFRILFHSPRLPKVCMFYYCSCIYSKSITVMVKDITVMVKDITVMVE